MNLAALPFFRHIKWHPDAGELHRFAVAMLIGFSVLGLLSGWRSGAITTTPIIFFSSGVLLAIASIVPKLGRIAYLTVYVPASIMGYVVSHIVLGLMFLMVITPLGVSLRLMGKDLLQQRPNRDKSRWKPVQGIKTEDSYYRQF